LAFQRRIPPTDGRYVAARTIDFGDRVIAEGEPFPWREMGMDERQVQRRWWSGELEAAPAEAQAPVSANELSTVGEHHGEQPVTINDTASKLTRAERRALRSKG
jgi:hypothetical protein